MMTKTEKAKYKEYVATMGSHGLDARSEEEWMATYREVQQRATIREERKKERRKLRAKAS